MPECIYAYTPIQDGAKAVPFLNISRSDTDSTQFIVTVRSEGDGTGTPQQWGVITIGQRQIYELGEAIRCNLPPDMQL